MGRVNKVVTNILGHKGKSDRWSANKLKLSKADAYTFSEGYFDCPYCQHTNSLYHDNAWGFKDIEVCQNCKRNVRISSRSD